MGRLRGVRVVVLVGMTIAASRPALAGPKKKVQVESSPAGAQVYVNLIEDGVVCTTPCEVQVDVGETTLIVDLEGYKAEVDTIVVTKKDKNLKKSYKLVASVGKIIIEGPKGASVTIDDEDKGKAPLEVDVTAGFHAVALTLNGKSIYGQSVEVARGQEVKLSGSTKVADSKPPPDDPPDTPTKPEIRKPVEPARPRAGSIIAVGAAFSVGFRDFAYKNPDPMNDKLTTESEAGQVLAGPTVEVWPGTLAGIRTLRGLSMLVRFQLGLNSQTVQRADNTPTSATTFWRSFEATLKQRWTIANSATIEVGGGFVRDQHQFEGMTGDIEFVPDADYQSVRIGGRASLLLGSAEPYVAFENRIVLAGGALEERFSQGANANGLRGAVGLGASFGKIGARLEASFTRYTWTFTQDPLAANQADGASDSIKQVGLAIGYAY
ncbi:MAG TPA: PEGA domain-containing protein [Kofleriaceae bacterium]|nr:PEGA domain-containing protein [Kofleriaceae bacterium]